MSKKKSKSGKKAKPKAKSKAKAKKPQRKPAKPAKAAAKRKPAAKAKAVSAGPRQSWLDDAAQKPVIDRYARQLTSFIEAMADGVVDEAEVQAQEARLVKLMKETEPLLDAAAHAKVTELLCELTAYDLMQVLHTMHAARPQTEFQG